jgi:hypothetical protein
MVFLQDMGVNFEIDDATWELCDEILCLGWCMAVEHG